MDNPRWYSRKRNRYIIGGLVVLALGATFTGLALEFHWFEHNSASQYYLFVQTWQPSACLQPNVKCNSMSADWVIHGLWPNYYNLSWPQFCAQKPFNVSQLESLKPRLLQHWPSYNGRNAKFWKHEWRKHGTCTSMSLLEYFVVTLDLQPKMNVTGWFDAEDLFPLSEEKYSLENFTKVIGQYWPINSALLECIEVGGDFFLFEIRFCLSLNFRPINCVLNSTCPEHFYYPVCNSTLDFQDDYDYDDDY